MALFKDDEGRTEKATPQRLDEARNKGHVPLSHELVMAATLLVAVVLLERFGHHLVAALQSSMRAGLDVRGVQQRVGSGEVPGFLQEILAHVFIVGPWFLFFLLAFLAATALFGYGQIGFRLSLDTLSFKGQKLNPITNLQRLFSFASVTRTLISAGKLVLLATVLWLVLRSRWQSLANLYRVDDFASAVLVLVEAIFAVFFWIAAAVLVLSAADVAWQRFDYARTLRMTRQEVEDERKRNEGDPFVKSRQRGARMALMRQRMMEMVGKADVVITNPDHFAVALRYDRLKNSAPEVVAKGLDELALKIKELARQHGVPLMEDPPLARALYRAVKVGQEIPERFYKAVAAVLSHVLRLRGKVA